MSNTHPDANGSPLPALGDMGAYARLLGALALVLVLWGLIELVIS